MVEIGLLKLGWDRESIHKKKSTQEIIFQHTHICGFQSRWWCQETGWRRPQSMIKKDRLMTELWFNLYYRTDQNLQHILTMVWWFLDFQSGFELLIPMSTKMEEKSWTHVILSAQAVTTVSCKLWHCNGQDIHRTEEDQTGNMALWSPL